MPDNNKQAILAAIAAIPAIGPLATGISARAAINALAIAQKDPQISSELQTAYAAIDGGSQGMQPVKTPQAS